MGSKEILNALVAEKQQEKHRQSKDEKHLAMPAAGVPPYYSSY